MRVRIGKDIYIRWAILTDGSALPLAGRDLVLEMHDPRGQTQVVNFKIEGNTLTVYFPGVEQTKVGDYSFTLWENKGKPRQTVVDKLSAFSLVRYSTQEELSQGNENVDILVDLGTSSLTTIAGATVSTLVLNLTGYKSLASVDDLPNSPSTLGYLIGTRLYVWVGEGGDTLNGQYKDCGEFKGEKGDKGNTGARGPQGNSGYQGNINELEVVNNLTQGGGTAALSAEMGKELKGELDKSLPTLVTPQEMAAMKAQGTWSEFLSNHKFVCVSEE